ncbi:hypothetical protein BJAS_P3961 [Bathymodiolus japonicus methanotrophic gill symbiont]|uniref:hypothetical protein n=1 Tax=Bathymodiolus japonicus methanotrophic gill symbiont TaxID=113269 RepID=UPI001B5CB218|nr:hypothetical protein [Bathymodiolus japonicus methanotrophic gill symbiont]GFO73249.1 hypothetical protein BJAS_P3961 [Bathymodiolus japonicus methanotrophic gill symbiont]
MSEAEQTETNTEVETVVDTEAGSTILGESQDNDKASDTPSETKETKEPEVEKKPKKTIVGATNVKEPYVHPDAPDEYTIDESYLETLEDEQIDSALLDTLAPAFKAANISNKQFNAVVKAHTEEMNIRAHEATRMMQEETMADPLFSGDDSEANLQLAHEAIKEYGTDELSNVLHTTGLGNNIHVVKMLYNIGAAMQEDVPVGRKGKPQSVEESNLDEYYPNTKKS